MDTRGGCKRNRPLVTNVMEILVWVVPIVYGRSLASLCEIRARSCCEAEYVEKPEDEDERVMKSEHHWARLEMDRQC